MYMIYVVNPLNQRYLRYTLKYNIRHHHVRDVIAAYTYTSPSARSCRLFYGIIEPRTNCHQNKITLRNLHHAWMVRHRTLDPYYTELTDSIDS